jgi:N utilization substance protein B
MSRREARILALEALYAYEAAKHPVEELLRFGWKEPDSLSESKETELAFARLLISGVVRNIKRIDKTIKKHLQNWELSRLKRVDLAILRLSTYSLLFQPDMPPGIIIDEAIELSMEYSTDDSYKFVNAVLDSIKTNIIQYNETQNRT